MSDTTIDDLLDQTFAYGVDWTEYKDKSEYDHNTSMFAAKIKAQQKKALKSALYDLILKEVVGEDVPFSLAREMEMGEFDMSARKLESQNSLRASQRNKLKQLFNEKE